MAVNFMESFDFSQLPGFRKTASILPSPDQYLGELNVSESSITFSRRKQEDIDYQLGRISYQGQPKDELHYLLVVLESPHRFEYDIQKQPVGLIRGKSGDNFFLLFASTLQKSSLSIRPGTYHVICANAVQYQSSCGLDPLDRRLRDQNWIDIFDRYGGATDFRQRVFAIKPRYTINLCTGGSNPQGLRLKVSQSLDAMGLIKGKHYTEGNHPASWMRGNDTSNAKIY